MQQGRVEVDMTLTAPACPVAGTLPKEVGRVIDAGTGGDRHGGAPGVESPLVSGPDVRGGAARTGPVVMHLSLVTAVK